MNSIRIILINVKLKGNNIMAWINVITSSGNPYRLFKQEKSQSCGVACAMMVLKLKQNRELDEGTGRRFFGKAEGAVNLDGAGVRDFDALGSTQSPIIGVLSKYGIQTNQVAPQYVEKWLRLATPTKPVILGVDWGVSGVGQGGHWVVCVQYGQKLVCLDPYYGLVETLSSLFPFYFIDAASKGRINDLIQLA
ncbi:C39 family peptidase [Catalinimonas sp. 4WD22]|uniref:C39 family peptidase n=1 Tax=Catalinimonas locisalis TaxID=3133978 RepID=UPI003100F0D7